MDGEVGGLWLAEEVSCKSCVLVDKRRERSGLTDTINLEGEYA